MWVVKCKVRLHSAGADIEPGSSLEEKSYRMVAQVLAGRNFEDCNVQGANKFKNFGCISDYFLTKPTTKF